MSRVGSSAQVKAIKQVAGSVKLELAQFRELQSFAQFGSDLDASTKQLIERGKRLTELLKQHQYDPLQMEEETASIYSGVNGYLDKLEVSQVTDFEHALLRELKGKHSAILNSIKKEQKITDSTEKLLKDLLESLVQEFTKGS